MCRFAANGWPITTTTNQGLGVQVKDLIVSSAVSMGTATEAKIAGGFLDAYAALQLVPDDPSSTSSTSALSSSFGDTTSPSPEEENPFSSSSATQSGDFDNAAAPAPALSAQQQAVSSAVQAAAAAAVNTTLNATHSVYGGTQAVAFTSSGSALAPEAAAVLINSLSIPAPEAAPMAVGAPEAAFVPQAAPAVPSSQQQMLKFRKFNL